ncbi:class I SAM-dependent methyltransferase [Tautonia plasticadhaerens]|uniref:Putative S-adenosylmethionine-dependent methyltransferase/MSMEI_2290 n=1 Tax=Tautonia plasticadhaerens TaxID=2527974 RepID=A0A518GV95_9BACT|nr:class I SAM-dependent methyltransferase [Tautonia plasticadhaerens]QDV32510.1 putative S-adenosylmethionine-dependent methyltransferase/MSMEI_2290 [Tautonia plasticadhaerens]
MAHVSASIRPPRPARPVRPTETPDDRPRPGWDHDAEIRTIRALWGRQKREGSAALVHGADLDYAAAHIENDVALRRRLRVLDQVAALLPPRGRVFEWGCQHALDSCVYRMRFGDALELHGADLYEPGPFHVFHEFSGLYYKPLDHPVFMPYPDGHFDVITSNGVLEHVDDDATSLYEISRILRPGGTFILTCLPNRLSYTEALQRLLGHNAHDRLYSLRSAAELLRPPGFEVVDAGHSFVLPTMLYGFPPPVQRAFRRLDRPLHRLNAALERLWPLKLIASNLWLVARKPDR